MGQNVSVNDSTILQDILNSITTNVMTSVAVSMSTFVSNTQNFTFNNTGTIECENFSVNQKIGGSVKAVNVADLQVTTTIATELQNEMSAKIDQVMKGVYEMLGNIGTSNNQRNRTYLKQSIQNYIQTNINNNIVVSSLTEVINVQNQTINNPGVWKGKNCTYNQDIVLDIQTQTLVKAIINNAVNNKAINRAVAIVKQDNSMEVKGLVSLVSAIFGFLLIGLIIFVILFFII